MKWRAAPSLCAKVYVGTPRFFTTHRISTIVETHLERSEHVKRLNHIERITVEAIDPWCALSPMMHDRIERSVYATVYTFRAVM